LDWTPRPVPYFAFVDGHYIAVPRKKPHSTSSYDGDDFVPLPELEPAPMFESMQEPPAKRQRRGEPTVAVYACAHCAKTTATMTDRVNVFCGTHCQLGYFYDH
jgi:hypothetical protein